MLACAFRVNELNKRRLDANEERERKRQIEIQHAQKARQQIQTISLQIEQLTPVEC